VKLTMGQEVWLLNPRAVKQKVARGTISGIVGLYKFHFQVIRDRWLKVDIQEALVSDAALMFPNDATDHSKVEDIVNRDALWNM
jgi:hypothetical protein